MSTPAPRTPMRAIMLACEGLKSSFDTALTSAGLGPLAHLDPASDALFLDGSQALSTPYMTVHAVGKHHGHAPLPNNFSVRTMRLRFELEIVDSHANALGYLDVLTQVVRDARATVASAVAATGCQLDRWGLRDEVDLALSQLQPTTEGAYALSVEVDADIQW